MHIRNILVILAAVLTGTAHLAVAQPADTAKPPVAVAGTIKALDLPPIPSGMSWARIAEIDVAVPVPDGWQRHEKDAPFQRVFAFSDQPLDQNGLFERGLTVKLLWHPQLAKGNEAQAVDAVLRGLAAGVQRNKDNKILKGTLDEKNGKRVMIVRHRNAPTGLVPVIVHTMTIGDPQSGLVYQVIYEGPEATWDENWKIGEQILGRVYVAFQMR